MKPILTAKIELAEQISATVEFIPPDRPDAQVDRIDVTPSDFSLHVGETIQLVAKAFDAAGAPMPGVEFSWASTDDSVALVDGGLVTAVGEGSVDIIASADGVDGRATATIEAAPADRVEINNYKSAMEIGETYQFVAAVYDTNNEEIVGADIVWSSSDDDVLTVSEDGLVTSVGEGNADIVATFNGLHSSVGVESNYGLAATVTVTPSSATMDANDLEQFSAQAFNSFGVEIPGVSFQWSTTDQEVAVVDSGGLVEAYAGGSVDIVAAANGVTGSSALVVEGEVADVVASYDQILLLNPDVDVLLQLPRYRGQDMLFVDTAGTTVVDSVGDPIGGVWSLARGEMAAVAPSAVQRPTWQGVEEGAYTDEGDGVLDTLAVTFPVKSLTDSVSISICTDLSLSPRLYPRPFGSSENTLAVIGSGGNSMIMRSSGLLPQLEVPADISAGMMVIHTYFAESGEDSMIVIGDNRRSGQLDSADGPEVVYLANRSSNSESTRAKTRWLTIWHNHRLTEEQMDLLEALND